MNIRIPQDLNQLLSEQGFVLITASEEVRRRLEIACQRARDFFNAPDAEKLSARLSFDCGYRPPGLEYSSSSELPDAIESFTATMRTREEGHNLPSQKAFDLHDVLITLFQLLEPIAEQLGVRFSEAAGGKGCGSPLAGRFRRWSRLQMNYARPAASAVQFTNDLHEDGHLLTIAYTTAPGLEILTQQQYFACPRTSPGDLIVMPGNIAWLLSGGGIRPLYHRVRRIEDQNDRVSLMFFADIDPRYCTPWVDNEINERIDVGAAVLSNYSRFGVSDFPID